MPAGSPPHKQIAGDPGPQRRLEMCRLLVRGADRLSVCALETEREGPSYTVDTLRELHERDPETELTFIVGADVAGTLPSDAYTESSHFPHAASPRVAASVAAASATASSAGRSTN